MSFDLSWVGRMAWRDSRRQRVRLLFFCSPLIFGVAALVAIHSLRNNVAEAIDDQSRALLGADLVISAQRPFEEEAQTFFDEIGGDQMEEISFTTMGYFPASDGAKLVDLRAVESDFPYYGELQTRPEGIWENGLPAGSVLLEESLLEQMKAKVGDEIRFGSVTMRIAGVLTASPPRASFFSAFAPQVLIRREDMQETGLLTSRSLANYRRHFKLPRDLDVEALMDGKEHTRESLRVSYSTPDKQRRNIGRNLDRLYRFLSLIGLSSIILGGIGISSAIHQHLSRRLTSIAILRCLGCTSKTAFAVYLLQALALGLIGCGVGCLGGVAIQAGVLLAVEKISPLGIPFQLSWSAIGVSMAISLIICMGFALLPLLKIRRIPPLAAIRAGLLQQNGRGRDPLVWATLGAMTLLFGAFSVTQASEREHGFAFFGGLIVVFGLLFLIAQGLMKLSRKLIRPDWPFPLRQGMANLYRPHNQTTTFMLGLGLGSFLIITLSLIQFILLQQLEVERLQDRGNLYLIDIQPDQREEVIALLKEQDAPILQDAPIISMRLSGIRGRSVQEMIDDPNEDIPNWVLRRDFRSTFRSNVTESEKLLRGEWIARVDDFDPDEPVPVSMDEGIAKDLGVDLGDEVAMDVQGLTLKLKIASIREVDWGTMSLNFFIVFPEGVLEDALSFYVLTTYAGTPQESAAIQSSVVKSFPGVTIIDLTLVFELLESIVSKIAFAIQFMAGFTVLTGLFILVATLISGRSARLREMALLRTLGASHKVVRNVLTWEYVLLGFFASVTGAILAVFATIPLAIYLFEAEFRINAWPIFGTIAGATLVTLVVGGILSRGTKNTTPLEILRSHDSM